MTPICLPFVVNLLAIIFVEVSSENVQVTTNEGTILGTTSLSEKLNKTMYMFLSIPYAEPPKRFELSVPKSSWSGVLNCTFERAQCLQTQYDVIQAKIEGSEDCLFLSVFSPNLTGRAPVLVWIHGGGFIYGNGSLISNSPELFLEEGLVVVGIQYRLGIFGFISTGDLTCPGNWGLKDQTLALQWVQRNIPHFGGDPKRVTIWGQSAGAGSVALHLTSVRSKGLFCRAIMNSGTSISLWSRSRKSVELAHKIGDILGVGSANSSALIKNLKKVDSITLHNVSYNLNTEIFGKYALAGILLAPVIEVPHPTAFLTVKCDQSLRSGEFTRVPVLTGYTSNELPIIAPATLSASVATFNQDPTNFVPAGIISNKNLTEAGLKIRKEFLGDVPTVTLDNSLIHLFNVDQMIRPPHRFVADVKKYVPNTYLYQFSYQGDIEKTLGYNFSGAVHSEDLYYLFKANLPFSKKDLAVRSKMVKMWSNFCKYGKPIPLPTSTLDNIVWLPASITPRPLLFNIDYKNRYIINPYLKELKFYDKQIFGKYGQGVYDTY
ncbi:juvenile hormone esterase-like isoform X2 [Diabrotica virgifera virgifera]|uniref:Carboxylic ester hydrolase n=1 Tax=Diabrotica virgifera virgifera TaxID=50390 RepID=A0ABM5KZ17_DIAVI|nr:juvenile hormone esterase-like isoform X2 [Diabrotica virgifera virgifera]